MIGRDVIDLDCWVYMKVSELENGNNWNKRQGQGISYGGIHHLFLKESSSHEVGREQKQLIIFRIFFKSSQRWGKKTFVLENSAAGVAQEGERYML